MKFTRSWLEEHTNINTSIEELYEDLTMAGLEVDEITPLKNDFLIDVDFYSTFVFFYRFSSGFVVFEIKIVSALGISP